MTTKVLNLYAGIGGNRKLWEDVEVTAVEWDGEKAEVYRDHFPEDNVVVEDAHEYLKDHIFESWDFIWASPPCPTHSQLETINHSKNGVRYPDMNLYQELILLRNHFDSAGFDYCVENVVSYYEPLIEPQKIARHYFWSNFHIPDFDLEPSGIVGNLPDRDPEYHSEFDFDEHQEKMGYDLSGYSMTKQKKSKALKNCVNPQLGKHVFEAATKNRQSKLFE